MKGFLSFVFFFLFKQPIFVQITPGSARFPTGLPKKNVWKLLIWFFTGCMQLLLPTNSVKALEDYKRHKTLRDCFVLQPRCRDSSALRPGLKWLYYYFRHRM